MNSGLGSRHKARVIQKSNQLTSKHDEEATGQCLSVEKDSEVLDDTTVSASKETMQNVGSRKQISRLDDLILEAVRKLKEPQGSSRHAIAEYIEEHHSAPPDFGRTLAANLNLLTENKQLVKVKHQYRIAPSSMSFDVEKDPSFLVANGRKKNLSEAGRHGIVILTKAQIDAELEKMKSMTAEEAVAAAAQAVAEAEATIREAEAAAIEAEEAEAEAEAAHCFAHAAQKALNCNAIRVCTCRIIRCRDF